MKVIDAYGEIIEINRRPQASELYTVDFKETSFIDNNGVRQKTILPVHFCGNIVIKAPATCICGYRIHNCGCGRLTHFSDVNNFLCLECALEKGYKRCVITGLFGECEKAEQRSGILAYVLKKKITKCKHDCGTNIIGKLVCNQCLEKHYFKCMNCSTITDKQKGKDKAHKVCDVCFVSTIAGKRGFLPSFRTFGIELELNSPNLTDPIWKTKTDGSVAGFEFTSPIYSGGTSFHKDINRFCNFVEKNNAKAGNDCGFHLHIGIQDFGLPDFINTYLNALKIQEWHYTLLPVNRKTSKFCRPLKEINFTENFNHKFETIADFFDKYENVHSDDNIRYRWLNFAAFKKFNTIEVRSHQGTCDPERIEKWAELWMSFIEFSKAGQELKDPYSMMSTMGVRKSTIKYFKNKYELMKCK